MEAKPENIRAGVPLGILWKWTGVSAVLHGFLIAALCGVSYVGFHQRETASKAKAAAEEAAAKSKEAEEAAKTPPVAAENTPDAKAAAAPPQLAPDPAKPPVQAEKILGIDQVAKPDEIPKSPFSTKGDDLLKDLK